MADTTGKQKKPTRCIRVSSLTGVITADDDAQAMFVVPYLKDKVHTPIMFNGVNAAAGNYGFPNDNISGILERAHVRESPRLCQTAAALDTNGLLHHQQCSSGPCLAHAGGGRKGNLSGQDQWFSSGEEPGELEAHSKSLRTGCDTLVIDSLEGILDSESKPMNNREALKVLTGIYSGPILGGNRYQVEQGAWAAVVKTGQEQGETSAEMLLQAMRGTPVAKIPVVRNSKGQRIINVTALESHGITPRPIVLRGATLVRQQP